MQHTSNEKISEALQLLEQAAKEKKDELKSAISDQYTHLKKTLSLRPSTVLERRYPTRGSTRSRPPLTRRTLASRRSLNLPMTRTRTYTAIRGPTSRARRSAVCCSVTFWAGSLE